MKPLTILWVGKPKNKELERAGGHYAKLLSRFVRLEQAFVKDAPGKLPPEERAVREGEALLAKLGGKRTLVCLDETGRTMTSVEFSGFVTRLMEEPAPPVFVVGGPNGLSDEVRGKADHLIALGPMTLPHELARLVLLEQIYRALAIAANLPYHNP